MADSGGGLERTELDVLQSDVDDESPQVLAAVVDHALAEGALDAHLAPLQMKKGRPGTRIEILCRPADRDRFVRLLLTESSTLGVKVRRVERYALPRRMETITVHGETIRIKVALLDGEILRASPEYEDCRAAAARLGQSLRNVTEEARAASLEWVCKNRHQP